VRDAESVWVNRPHVEGMPILNQQGQVIKARPSFAERVASVPSWTWRLIAISVPLSTRATRRCPTSTASSSRSNPNTSRYQLSLFTCCKGECSQMVGFWAAVDSPLAMGAHSNPVRQGTARRSGVLHGHHR
jgi:hypothetical protein